MYGLPRHLYHGTSSFAAEKILVEGIKPKYTTTWGNWPANAYVHPHMSGKFYANPYVVYLGREDHHAEFYANRAQRAHGGHGRIIRVDTARLVQTRFRADENYWGHDKNYVKVMDVVHRNRDWKSKIEKHGLLSYAGHIPVSAIVSWRSTEYGSEWVELV